MERNPKPEVRNIITTLCRRVLVIFKQRYNSQASLPAHAAEPRFLAIWGFSCSQVHWCSAMRTAPDTRRVHDRTSPAHAAKASVLRQPKDKARVQRQHAEPWMKAAVTQTVPVAGCRRTCLDVLNPLTASQHKHRIRSITCAGARRLLCEAAAQASTAHAWLKSKVAVKHHR